MKKTISNYDFRQEFVLLNRVENFTYEGLNCLFEALQDLEDDIDEQIELDVISLCCEFIEFDNLSDYNEHYATDMISIEEISDEGFLFCCVGEEGFITREH